MQKTILLPAGLALGIALACSSLNPSDVPLSVSTETSQGNPQAMEEMTALPAETEMGPDRPAQPIAPTAEVPDHRIRLIFIHHSSGENWLADDNGGLGIELMKWGYFVSDTNYDWGPVDPQLEGPIGSFTDTGNWWNWFLGPGSTATMAALYREGDQHASYSRLEGNPGGENEIILFKSCFPNSAMDGNPNDPPNTGENLLRGSDSGSGHQTVANAKGIYQDLLGYFLGHQEKFFVVITAPPLLAADTSPKQAANARAFNRWLVQDWLADYPRANVAVFDFYNVLTSNGGNPEQNDIDSPKGNHHRYRDGKIEYITNKGGDVSAYAENGDSHPTSAGNRKATAEFVPLLSIFYHRWKTSP
jgi:hypothetical protein